MEDHCCQYWKTISANTYGCLSKCSCGFYRVNFISLSFDFNAEAFQDLRQHIIVLKCNDRLNSTCWSCDLKCKKIPIPTQKGVLLLVLARKEFMGLNELIFGRDENHDNLIQLKSTPFKWSLN